MNGALPHATLQASVRDDRPSLEELLRSLRVFNSLRICLAATICVCISAWFRLPLGFASVISVLVLFSIYSSQLVGKGVERTAGRIVGAIAGLVLADLFFDTAPLFVVSMTAALFWGMYRYTQGKTPYASVNAGFTAAAIMILATFSRKTVTSFAFHWVLQVGIGVAVALIVNQLLPFRVSEALDRGTMEIFEFCSGRLLALAERVQSEPETDRTKGFSQEDFSEVIRLVESRRRLTHEGPFSPDLYLNLLTHGKTLFCQIQFLDEQIRGFPVEWRELKSAAALGQALRAISVACGKIADSIGNSSGPEIDKASIKQSVREVEDAYGAMRAEPSVDEEEREKRREFAGIVGSLQSIEREVLRAGVRQTESKPDAASIEKSFVSPASVTRAPGGHTIDWEGVRRSTMVCTTILIVFGCLLYAGIPGGEQGLVAGLIIGGQANAGQSLLKWRLRATGAFIGALYGLLAMFVVAHLPYFPVMLWLFLLGIFVASYVAGGPERTAYAGVQAGLAISVVLIYEAGPPVSLDAVEGRFWGAVIGGFVAMVVHYLFWPVDPLERLRLDLSRMLGSCGKLFRQSVHPDQDQEGEARRLSDLMTADIQNAVKLLNDSRHMIDGSRRGVDLYARVIARVMDLLPVLATLRRDSAEAEHKHALKIFLEDLSEVNEHVAQAFDLLQDELQSFTSLDTVQRVREIETSFHSCVEDFRRNEKTLSEGAASVATLAAAHDGIVRLLGYLKEISEATEALREFDSRE